MRKGKNRDCGKLDNLKQRYKLSYKSSEEKTLKNYNEQKTWDI